jgi:aspartate racemase
VSEQPAVIGVIGGMAWESSAVYYRLINQKIAGRLGGRHSARLVLNSVDFDEFIQWHRADDWAAVENKVGELAQELERAGARCIVIACVTQHEVADGAAKRVDIPFIHIADVTGEAIRAAGIGTVGLLGTRFTMERDFFVGRLRDRFDLDVLIPEDEDDRQYLHDTIFNEFAKGIFEDATRKRYLEIIDRLAARGAQGIILGCTEIPLLVRQDDVPNLPMFDTTEIHADAAVNFSLHEYRL